MNVAAAVIEKSGAAIHFDYEEAGFVSLEKYGTDPA